MFDDASFMSMMADEEMNHVEPSQDDECFVDPSPMKGRQMYYTTEEDDNSVLAWEAITLDAVNGVEQSASTYWQSVDHRIQKTPPPPRQKTQISLTNRWSGKQDVCNKWVCALE
ncbi:hypothetical protein BRADI_1g20594v3 [Brachypodium distachyon]|uniref:Uncharacterized protein n=1 Tax=Brachypodium distachyon TaxID=15368 RepID=A0A0Q3GVV6_BRADI|nr:hypothetical protein BRADI_1g20594v3 [Brachypodium distachyon]